MSALHNKACDFSRGLFTDRTPHACVLCATDGIYIADERDQGETAPHQETAR